MKHLVQQDPSLRTPEDQLASSRKQYVNSLTNQQQFEEQCLIIVPDLERQWKEKILVFGFPADTTLDWKSYLRYFKPQTLAAGIDLLVKRLKGHEERYGSVLPHEELVANIPKSEFAKLPHEEMKELINRAGGVPNVRGYYRQLIEDLRREEKKANPIRKHFNETIMKCVLEQASGADISFNIPQQTYEEAGVSLPEEHRLFAVKMGWIEEASFSKEKLEELQSKRRFPDKLTSKGEAVLEGLRGGFNLVFLIAVN